MKTHLVQKPNIGVDIFQKEQEMNWIEEEEENGFWFLSINKNPHQ